MGKSIKMCTLVLVIFLIVSSQSSYAGSIEENFDGTNLDSLVWINLTSGDGALSAVVNGSFHATRRQNPSRTGLKATPVYALAPEKDKVLRFSVDFAPDKPFTTKNNFFFGLQDESGKNSIFVQTGPEYGWGPWGVFITCEGQRKKSAEFAALNTLPGKNWLFEVTPGRVKIFCGPDYRSRLFDSKRDAPQGGGEWIIPTRAMVPVVLDDGSTGLGELVIDRIRFALDSPQPEPIVLIPGNGLSEELILASNGKAHASIVVADAPSEKVLQAARDLRETIKVSTGASLPIIEESDWDNKGPRILVGKSGLVEALGVKIPSGTGFHDQGIVVRRVGPDLVIAGNDDGPYKGTQDAVIRFLNVAIGADFYYCAPSGKVVPGHARLAVADFELSEQPALPHRTFNMYMAGQISPSLQSLQQEWYRWNHWGGTNIWHQHAHMMIAPPATYFEKHPEYYSEIRGKRSVSEPEGWQLCTTNPEVIQIAVDWCRRQLNANPGLQSVTLSNNDGGGMCTCAKCRKLDQPDWVSGGGRRAVTFVNAVARELAKTHPGKYVVFYAYLQTLEPPTDMKCEPNVVVVLADSSNCVFHSYDDPNCGLAQDARLRLECWLQIARHVVIYDYYGLYGDYMGLPFSNIRRTIKNARYSRSLGAEGFTYDATFTPGPQGLHYWTALRVCWDPTLTVDKAIKQYCDGLYGTASATMSDYYKHLEAACTRPPGQHSVQRTWVMPGPLYIWTEETFRTLQNDLDKAMSLVPPGSLEAERVAEQLLLLRFTRVFVDLKHAQLAYCREETEDHNAEYHKLRLQYLDLYKKLAEKGLISFAESTLNAYAPENLQLPKVDIELKRTLQPPSLDILDHDDPAWVLYGYHVYSFKDNDNFLAFPKTEAYLTYDAQSLYVRLNCHEYQMKLIKTAVQKKDGDVWQDDCVRLSVALPGESEVWDRYDFYVNTGGVSRDMRNGDVSWNAIWSAKSARSNRLGLRQWIVQMAIPWNTLGLEGPPAEMKANLFRHVTTPTVQPVQIWAPTFGSLDRTERYARIILKN